MASIENRSKFKVTVQNRSDLTHTFDYNDKNGLKAHLESLQQHGFKPKLSRLNDTFAVRVRQVGRAPQTLFAKTEEEAVAIKLHLEAQHRQGLFIDYGKARRVTLGDLLSRYLREEGPRHKGYVVEGYVLNALLEDAGLPRVDVAQACADHKNPHPCHAKTKFPKPSGNRMRTPSPAARFILKSFADLQPVDFNDYIDDRCQYVSGATVDRELDLLAATCTLAIKTWRIAVPQNPMDGVKRPAYFNERDRRLKSDEEQRLLDAAHEEDMRRCVDERLEMMMTADRAASSAASSTYQRKNIIKSARAKYREAAEATSIPNPLMETFINFMLMTGARRSEALSLTWDSLDLARQTAYLAETKNGRPRRLPIRSALVALLLQLPRISDRVFPMNIDTLRKAWTRVCETAGLAGAEDLHIHDLRHEAISRVADAGSQLPGGFSLVDLQAFSGHRDIRMLLRYTHLCTPSLAKRLDAAFSDETQISLHRGQRRLKKGAALAIGEVLNEGSRSKLDLNTASPTVIVSPGSAPSNVLAFRRRGLA